MSVTEISAWVSLGITITSILVSVIFMLIHKKVNKLASILALAPKYIIEAENLFGAGSGVGKLQYVLTKLQAECVKANVKADANELKERVEEILKTPQAKQVIEPTIDLKVDSQTINQVKRKDVED